MLFKQSETLKGRSLKDSPFSFLNYKLSCLKSLTFEIFYTPSGDRLPAEVDF